MSRNFICTCLNFSGCSVNLSFFQFSEPRRGRKVQANLNGLRSPLRRGKARHLRRGRRGCDQKGRLRFELRLPQPNGSFRHVLRRRFRWRTVSSTSKIYHNKSIQKASRTFAFDVYEQQTHFKLFTNRDFLFILLRMMKFAGGNSKSVLGRVQSSPRAFESN